MEQKKKSIWPLLIIIMLLLIIAALVFYILHNRTTNEVTTKTETNVKENTKNDTIVVDSAESSETMQIVYGSSYDDSKNGLQILGTIKVNKTSYEIKMESVKDALGNDEINTYIGDKKIEGKSIEYIAVMDSTIIVFKTKNEPSQMYFYDENLNEVHDSLYSLVNTFALVNSKGDGISEDVVKIKAYKNNKSDIIDSKHLIVAECAKARSNFSYDQDYVEKLLTFENGKITEQELTVVENVFCSSQRYH